MGKVILPQRKGKGIAYKARNKRRLPRPQYRAIDFAEKNGYVRGVVRSIFHDSGRGAPVAIVSFNDQVQQKKRQEIFIATEGMYTGQYIYTGKKADLAIGNVTQIGSLPEGTVISNVEEKFGDRGRLARSSGNSAIIVSHSGDGKTRLKLPSGHKKIIQSSCRATIGIVAGGGRTEKPMLKAGFSYYRHKARGKKNWPKVRGVAKNPVEHPHGGGNHQHVGMPTTVARLTTPGRKVGLIAARRTGRLRGGNKIKDE